MTRLTRLRALAAYTRNPSGTRYVGRVEPDGTVTSIASEFAGVTSQSLARWRKALANVRTGQGRAKVACVGDSTTTGWGAGTSTNGLAGARAKSFPTYLASVLAGMGLPTNTNSIWGTANLDNGQTIGVLLYGDYDTRVVYPSTFTSPSASPLVDSLGGRLFRCASPNTSSLVFTPTGSIDTVNVHYVKNSGNGTFTINFDGGATAATVDSNAAGALAAQNLTIAAGAHDVRVQRSVGGTVFVVGIEAYLSTAPAIDIWNMGAPGWKAGDWAYSVNAWSPANAIQYANPDLTFINLGINDWKDTPTDIATYTTNMQTVITAAKSGGGSCILVVPFPSQTTRASVAQQASFVQAIYSLASANGCGVVDMTSRFASWDAANALGFAYNDLHPNSYGYADMAAAFARVLQC